MLEYGDSTGSKLITCELSADDFDLNEGDTIAPGSEIGIDIRSGSAVYLGTRGSVASVYYNRMNDSYLLTIYYGSHRPGLSSLPKKSLILA